MLTHKIGKPLHRPIMRSLLLAAALIATLCPASHHLSARQVEGDQKIDLSLADAQLEDVLRSFARILGARLDMASEIQGLVTLELHQVSWGAALDRVCRQHALRCLVLPAEEHATDSLPVLRVWRVGKGDGEPGLKEPFWDDPLLNLSLKDADLRQVLESFGEILEKSITIAEDLEGKVTMEAVNMPASLLLREICRLHGCQVEESSDGSLRIVATATGAAARSPMFNVVLRGIEVSDALQVITQAAGLGAPEGMELRIDESIGSRMVAVALNQEWVDWVDALETICEQAGCRWRLTYGTLKLRLEVVPAESPSPESGIVGRVGQPPGLERDAAALRLHLTTPGGTATTDDRLTWSRPLTTVTRDGWQGRLVWLPLGGGRQVVVPLLLHCPADDPQKVEGRNFDVLALPLPEAWSGRWDSVVLDVVPAGADHPTTTSSAGSAATDPCSGRVSGRIGIRWRDGPWLTMSAEPGTYLLLDPGDDAEPKIFQSAAVLALHPIPQGGFALAWIEPGPAGGGIYVQQLPIFSRGFIKAPLRTARGATLPLEIRFQ